MRKVHDSLGFHFQKHQKCLFFSVFKKKIAKFKGFFKVDVVITYVEIKKVVKTPSYQGFRGFATGRRLWQATPEMKRNSARKSRCYAFLTRLSIEFRFKLVYYKACHQKMAPK
ncbi:hypothetical protein [Halobacillus faecis]|uniref:Uncharacterized protein n=1 Tax=Halobacillus faecis TaxID=360184 RepID=A0A511WRX5_9BACI|nr:hypothetical protein [Halobacillus faecis]GEN53909.1 hypothetical protein HFA01_21710 [Halobacillus faecis]